MKRLVLALSLMTTVSSAMADIVCVGKIENQAIKATIRETTKDNTFNVVIKNSEGSLKGQMFNVGTNGKDLTVLSGVLRSSDEGDVLTKMTLSKDENDRTTAKISVAYKTETAQATLQCALRND